MRDQIQFCSAFIDGVGYFGEVTKLTLPKMTVATRDFSASGMSGPIKVRMSRLANALEAMATFDALPPALYDTLSVSEGQEIPFRFKASTQGQDGTATAHEIIMRGFVEEFDEGEWEDAKDNPFTLKLSLRHYERLIGGQQKWLVNPEAMQFSKNGVDLLAAHRANIGR